MKEDDCSCNPKEVEAILKKIKSCVRRNKYIISQNDNRKENRDFIDSYRLTTDKQKSILLNIEIRDFCYATHNKHKGFEREILYIFVPQVPLYCVGTNKLRKVDIYIKFNLIEQTSSTTVVVISFHRKNKNVEYPFR